MGEADGAAPFIDVAQQPGELRRIFVSLGLAEAHEAPRVQPLAGGVSSGIYRVDLRSGSYCLKQALPQLKTAKVWKVPIERVFHEVAWLRSAGQVVPGHVPRVLGVDAASKSFVMEFLGEGFANWKAQLLGGAADVGAAAAVGRVIGRIHAASARDAAMPARFATDANFHSIRLEPYLVETARVHPALAGQLLALVERTQAHKRALVHGDLSPKNILLGRQGPVLLDAECAWWGDPAFDLAFCLNHLLLKWLWLPALRPALAQSFDALVLAYFAEADFEPRAPLEERIATLLPALALARVDGKSPAEYLDGPARLRVRAAAMALLAAPSGRLAEVQRRWALETTREPRT